MVIQQPSPTMKHVQVTKAKVDIEVENQQSSIESNEYRDMKRRVMSKEFLLDSERYVINTQTIS